MISGKVSTAQFTDSGLSSLQLYIVDKYQASTASRKQFRYTTIIMKINVFVVFICATAFTSLAAYSEEKVVKLIRSVPLEEVRTVMVEETAVQSVKESPKTGIRKFFQISKLSCFTVFKILKEGIPKTFSDILTFYRIHNSANLLGTPRVGEIVCFPWGCIDINDPSMNVHMLIFTVPLVICSVLAAPSKKDKEFIDNILENVPTEARRRFIQEQLFAGYLKTESLEYKLADDKAIQLYNIFMRNCPKIMPHSGLLRERICLPNGHCFDPEDSGVYP
nr:unnamed protein product [Callosobruchus chinensis]